MPPIDPIAPPPEPRTEAGSGRILIDDLGRFPDTAGAFWMALEYLRTARSSFGPRARDLGRALGDPNAAAQYRTTYESVSRMLGAMEDCFQQFFESVAAAGRAYQQAEDSVSRGMR